VIRHIREPKDRLVLEGRGEESTGLAVRVSRVALLDSDGLPAAVCEDDLMFPPEWNRRTVVLGDSTAWQSRR
jgi:hypothetical protein